MRTQHLIGAAALALVLSACGAESGDDALANVPDAAGLTLEIQGGAPEALAAGASVAQALTSTPHVEDDLAAAREKIAALNEAVRTVFARVEEVASGEAEPEPGEGVVYGPVERCVVPDACDAGGTATFRLRVFRAPEDAWAFALQAQVEGEWRPVAAGWLRRGEVERRGAGRIVINLENLRAAAPAYPGQGHLLGGFSNGPVAKSVAYRLLNFTPDPARWPATTAAFRGFKTARGVTRVRVATIADLYGDPGSEDELGFGHVAYHPLVGGRAFAVVANLMVDGAPQGDVPASDLGEPQYFFGRACYAPGETTPAFKEWFLCARSQGPRACIEAQGGVGEPVAGAPGATWQSACAAAVEPPELLPPAPPPLATPEEDGPEAGEDGMGLAPEAPPAHPGDFLPPPR
jgi:hypothetical protein